MEVWILLLVGLVIASLLIYYFSPTYIQKMNVTATGPYDLNQTARFQIINNRETTKFFSGNAGTFSAFVFLTQANRTGVHPSCGSGSGSSSCSDVCSCSPSGCGNCAHVGYKQVFNIGEIIWFEVLIAPDASRQNLSAAQIAVKTMPTQVSSGAQNLYTIETIRLPNLDMQKWTYVTIVRDGRLIDVFYNDTLILSKKLINPVAPITPLDTTNSGSPGLDGRIININMYDYRLSTKGVAKKYTEYSDTRGNPFFNDSSNPMSLSSLGGVIPSYTNTMFSGLTTYIPTINLCPSGNCISSPTIKPANPLTQWSTNYA